MKIPLKKKLINLKGDPFKTSEGDELTLGLVIAEALISNPSEGKMKMYVLAQKAYTDKDLEVDSADLILIKKIVGEAKIYNGNNAILGQVLLLLEEVK